MVEFLNLVAAARTASDCRRRSWWSGTRSLQEPNTFLFSPSAQADAQHLYLDRKNPRETTVIATHNNIKKLLEIH